MSEERYFSIPFGVCLFLVIELKLDMHPSTEIWLVSWVDGICEARGCEEIGSAWLAVVKMKPGRSLVNFDGRWYSNFPDTYA
jgi:hypothetical protein